jgi:hypothetical protein
MERQGSATARIAYRTAKIDGLMRDFLRRSVRG